MRRALLAGYFQANLASKFRGCHKQIHDAARDRSQRDHCDVIHTYKRDEQGEEVLNTPRNIPITLGLDDFVRAMEPGTFSNLTAVPILVV